MIMTETPDKPTGSYSRIQEPFAPLSPANVLPMVQSPANFTVNRNELSGCGCCNLGFSFGIWDRIKAWFGGK